jgi:phosphatidylethanolamine/phosphatidyl-N-methylethanolamine N-methyltransferase
MDIDAVGTTYKRWAPVYDGTFGKITTGGRRRAVRHVNARGGDVLEVGVGTGLSLGDYDGAVSVTGIDFSQDMLDRAHDKVAAQNLSHVSALRQMDARHLDFPDASFDTVVAMYLVSVVPEPERVVAEMARVCRPGGEVVIVNHFARETGALARVERAFAPFANRIGWHSDFSISTVLGCPLLREVERSSLPPAGLFTFLRLVRLPRD